jgi:23S rRNA (uracil1939-C5)-methyltransferase
VKTPGRKHARGAPAGRPAGAAETDITIEGLGSAGDGIAESPDGDRIHVPRTLPGEQARIATDAGGRARLVLLHQASPLRIPPPCPHFQDLCGGCSLQHMDDAAYADWKRGLVVDALARAGFPAPNVAALIRTPPHARRRMDFAVRRRDGGVLLGLNQIHGTAVIDLLDCQVLHPSLLALLPPLRKTLSSLAALGNTGSVIANLLPSGADLLVRTDRALTPIDRIKLAAFAAAHDIPRIAWALGDGPPETAAQTASPHALFAGHRVEPPPGAFLQASAEGEAAIVAAVLAALPAKLATRSRAVELYAGIGTLSFPLAAHLRVQAFEGDQAAAAALRRAQSNTHIETTARDLARQPLAPKEFSGAAMIVLDPPYAGAALQMPAIAASGVRMVVYISCNPAALGKDAALLARAGYRLRVATPIDQFLWSAHVECVAAFEKA